MTAGSGQDVKIVMPEAVRGEIERVFNSVPVLDERRDSLASEADKLYLYVSLWGVSNHPNANITGLPSSRRELQKLAALSFKLGEHILSMHRNALDAIERSGGPAPTLIVEDLKKLMEVFPKAESSLSPTARINGRRANKQARAATHYAAKLFTRLTGKSATPGHNEYTGERSDFEKFLTGVFAALHVEANAERQAKYLARDRRHRK